MCVSMGNQRQSEGQVGLLVGVTKRYLIAFAAVLAVVLAVAAFPRGSSP
jgi:hypothetical protein